MHPEATRRLGHALQAISSIQRYTANVPLRESLSDDLTRSAVERQLGIVQEVLRDLPKQSREYGYVLSHRLEYPIITVWRWQSRQALLLVDMEP